MWGYLASILQVPNFPRSMSNIWTTWRVGLQLSHRMLGVVTAKALIWNTWLTRNDHIFNANVVPTLGIILKIDYLGSLQPLGVTNMSCKMLWA